MSNKAPTVDQVVKKYVSIRDDLATERKKFKGYETAAKEGMERLSMWLRDMSDELGVDAFKTAHGTAYKSEKTYARVADWDTVLEFIKRTDNFQMLEKRISKLATIEIIEEDNLEPSDIGVEFGADIEFLVRRPDKRG